MSETPEFNELGELHKDLKALDEDLKDLNEDLTYLVSWKEFFVRLFEAGLKQHEKDETELAQYRNFLGRVSEGGLLPTSCKFDRELKKLDNPDDFVGVWMDDIVLMIMKQKVDRKMQTKKQQILDKEEEIRDKKKVIEEEESMTEEQIRERGIKSYRW
ncbi:unnamed protein product [Clonostachys solani]|uniref:Uncharacterized protein n=1 Tax=Clonostachys solani TaxID=160281 RepID=A0A9N9ZEZ1_9HYPO|nr:unnamed protein product [Clonostachys solani]